MFRRRGLQIVGTKFTPSLDYIWPAPNYELFRERNESLGERVRGGLWRIVVEDWATALYRVVRSWAVRGMFRFSL